MRLQPLSESEVRLTRCERECKEELFRLMQPERSKFVSDFGRFAKVSPLNEGERIVSDCKDSNLCNALYPCSDTSEHLNRARDLRWGKVLQRFSNPSSSSAAFDKAIDSIFVGKLSTIEFDALAPSSDIDLNEVNLAKEKLSISGLFRFDEPYRFSTVRFGRISDNVSNVSGDISTFLKLRYEILGCREQILSSWGLVRAFELGPSPDAVNEMILAKLVEIEVIAS
jgi:hypothetical protein